MIWFLIGPVKQLLPGNGGARRKRKRVQDLSSDEESGIKHKSILLLIILYYAEFGMYLACLQLMKLEEHKCLNVILPRQNGERS